MANRDALWDTGHDESVEVNQRALIDKVLARYSGEFTVFRELLQNSDDAQSKAVEIRFETQKYVDRKNGKIPQLLEGEKKDLPDLNTALVHRWVFKNNGIIFRDQDWSRLKKIAEGNPDEEKIGAFGVGFYSLFSVTEEPFVTSGDQWMGFYWKDKKAQLFARRGTLPPEPGSDGSPNIWTSFEMTLREPGPIPGAFDFTRFVASSITFMTHLSDVSIYFDDKRLARLTKNSGVPRVMDIPRGLKKASTGGMMHVSGVKATPLHIKAEVIRWVYTAGTKKTPKTPPPVSRPNNKPSSGGFLSTFSSFFNTNGNNTPQRVITPLPVLEPEPVVDLLATTETRVTLSVFAAEVDVKLDKKMSAELHRSTKKKPPAKLKYELIYTAKDEYDASIKEDEKESFATGSVFQGLRADLDGSGSARIFIGHATGQTTGIGGHMATRFIPTVERESIDLVDRNVAVWNRELLYVGGFLARTAYELELANIKQLWDGAAANSLTLDPQLQTWLRGRALHALKFFTFNQSTPSSDVSTLLEAAFFSCSDTRSFSIISTAGVRNAADVRLPDPTFTTFVKQLPVLPEEVTTEVKRVVAALRSRGMLLDIRWPDVLEELRKRPMPEVEVIACLTWWVGLHKQGNTPDMVRIRADLLEAAVLTTGTPGSMDERIIPLNSVQTFLNMRAMGNLIPVDAGVPLPDHLLPLSVSKNFDPTALQSAFPWRELTVSDWLKYILNPKIAQANVEYDISKSASWAERVFSVLARSWPSLSKESQTEIVDLLKDTICIPTNTGLKLPAESYFSTAHVFKDLPIVTFPSGMVIKGGLERVLIATGVRKHVELQIVFDRMIKTGDWTVADLVKYLVNVQSTLSSAEIERLQVTSAFTKEGDTSPKKSRVRAVDLYEPNDTLRQLGLPIIDYGLNAKWKANSEEAKFLHKLGLRRSPPLKVLVELCASPNEKTRVVALKYFIDNHTLRYSDFSPVEFKDIAFIPALDRTTTRMGKHSEVFSNPEWASLGFLIAHPSLNADALLKLKVKERPDPPTLVSLLEKTPPKDEATARQWFASLAGHVADFTSLELKKLSQLPIVPTKHVPRIGKVEQIPGLRWLPPNQCYFAGDARAQFHSKLFSFVDFGLRGNQFLAACGTKQEPSVEEVTRILLDNPHQFFELADGYENFLVELRNIAINRRQISSSTLARMKKASILLASKRQPIPTKGTPSSLTGEVDEDDWELKYDLKRADQIVIADDLNGYQLFGDQIFAAPQEDLLESFYHDLGSRRLSSLIKEEYKMSSEVKLSKVAVDVRALILERLPLFLHEHTHSRPNVSHSWLSEEKNFVVKTFGKLSVTKSLFFGDVRLSKSQDASAVAKRAGYGPIELWLAGHAQVDMYEVSVSLCRLLFQAPKSNDALLFMTILSTDLRSLKRRGYNVDRILRQQKAERQAAEDAARAAVDNSDLISKPTSGPPPPVPNSTTRPMPPPTTSPPSRPLALPGSFDINDHNDLTRSPKPLANLMQNWKRKLAGTSEPQRDEQVGTSPVIPAPPNTPRPKNPQVTPKSSISSNIDMAIKACTQEQGHLLRNREHMQMVKESLDEAYCDVSGRAGDLDFVGSINGIKIYAAQDIPQSSLLITTKRDAIIRFINVFRPLGEVYKLPPTSLHIFYDQSGEMIAFNRNASIFLNLRFYEAWRQSNRQSEAVRTLLISSLDDADVQKGTLSQARISWFFTLAHEIAHNLVQPHNSEHEFYFSAICEAHILAFGKLLAST